MITSGDSSLQFKSLHFFCQAYPFWYATIFWSKDVQRKLGGTLRISTEWKSLFQKIWLHLMVAPLQFSKNCIKTFNGSLMVRILALGAAFEVNLQRFLPGAVCIIQIATHSRTPGKDHSFSFGWNFRWKSEISDQWVSKIRRLMARPSTSF